MLNTRSNPVLHLLSLVHALLCGLFPLSATAQDYPSKPIRIIVAATPGTATDNVARIIAPEMRKVLGQPLVVENKPGADYRIGFEYVARQVPADGYTLLSVNVEIMALLPVLTRELRFNPISELPPVAGVAEGKYTMAVPASSSWKTIGDFVAQAKANPGKLNFGAASPIGRLSSEQFLNLAGLSLVHVPYSEASRYWVDLAANEIQMGFVAVGTAITLGQKTRILAVTGDRRSPQLPDAPTFSELGYAGMHGLSYSINLRAGTPRATIEKIYAAISQAMQQAAVAAQLDKFQLEVATETPEKAQARLTNTVATFSEVAKKVGMKPE